MSQRELNLGIVAHVDAGKTTLTERLLYEAGVIDEIGSVDAGTTQTDTLDLERQRGITIKSAVTSFALGDVHVNLIDTPGHPDFIAEVERVLSVLDGAVLVISAVEGVQPQTRILMRALQRLRHTDAAVREQDRPRRSRRGPRAPGDRGTPRGRGRPDVGAGRARHARRVRQAPRRRLGAARGCSRRTTRRSWSRSSTTSRASRRAACVAELASQTQRVLVHPVFFGSALTGAGVDAVMTGIAELLPSVDRRPGRRSLGLRVQDRASAERREGRLRPDVLGHDPNARPAELRRGSRGQGDGDRRLRAGPGRSASVGRRGRGREAVGPRRRPDR